MREREEHDHIPPVDLPLRKKRFPIEPTHVIVGALILVAVLVVYLLLLARQGR